MGRLPPNSRGEGTLTLCLCMRRPFHPSGQASLLRLASSRRQKSAPHDRHYEDADPSSHGADRTAIYDKFSAVDRPCAIRSQIGDKVGDFGRLRPAADWNAAESLKD